MNRKELQLWMLDWFDAELDKETITYYDDVYKRRMEIELNRRTSILSDLARKAEADKDWWMKKFENLLAKLKVDFDKQEAHVHDWHMSRGPWIFTEKGWLGPCPDGVEPQRYSV